MSVSKAKLYRVMLEVADAEKGAEFYGELLGDAGRAVGGGRHYFDCGAVIFGVVAPGGRKKAKPIPQGLYFALAAVELSKIYQRAKRLDCLDDSDVHGESGAQILKRPWGERSFYAVDPWGNGLCFVDEETIFDGRHPRGG